MLDLGDVELWVLLLHPHGSVEAVEGDNEDDTDDDEHDEKPDNGDVDKTVNIQL